MGTNGRERRKWYVKSHNLPVDDLTTPEFQRFLNKQTKDGWTIRAIYYSRCNSLLRLEEFLSRHITVHYQGVPS